jgi:hypothetical protein
MTYLVGLDEDFEVIEALQASSAARWLADRMDMDQYPEGVTIWTQLIDAGSASFPPRLREVRLWRVERRTIVVIEEET